jgi:MFS family permease
MTPSTQREPRSDATPKSITAPLTNARYRVLGLTFLMAFMMYMERGAIGAATPGIMRDFHVNKITMGWSISAFNWSYALFQVPAGWLADRFGARITLACAMFWWAVFTAGTGLTWSASSLALTRFLFGMGEAGAFPSGSRALVRWLPTRQRAFGQGFQHSGARLGAALAPTFVAALIAISSWRAVFVIFGACGVVWSLVWFLYYRNFPSEHKGVNAAELALLDRDCGPLARPASALAGGIKRVVPWRRILTSSDVWVLSVIYFCYGCVLWLYLAWLPTYLREARHFTALGAGLAGVPLLGATVANVLGGILSDHLTTKWKNVRRGRLTVAIAGYAVAGLALLPGVGASDPVWAIVYLTVALAGLEMTVPVSWAMSIDLGCEFSGSVSAVMNTCGNLGGAISAVVVGYLATRLGWTAPFLFASGLCLFAALLACRIDPRRAISS